MGTWERRITRKHEVNENGFSHISYSIIMSCEKKINTSSLNKWSFIKICGAHVNEKYESIHSLKQIDYVTMMRTNFWGVEMSVTIELKPFKLNILTINLVYEKRKNPYKNNTNRSQKDPGNGTWSNKPKLKF